MDLENILKQWQSDCEIPSMHLDKHLFYMQNIWRCWQRPNFS